MTARVIVVATGKTGPSGVGNVALDDVNDVVITSPITGAILRYDGTNWVDADGSVYFDQAGAAATAQAAAIATASSDATTKANAAQAAAIAASEPVGTVATHIGDTTDAHDASAISVLDTAANYTATDVEGVLAELPSQFLSLPGGTTGQVATKASNDEGDVVWDTLTIDYSLAASATPALNDTVQGTDVSDGNLNKQFTISAILALLVDAAPGALDTLNELAAALGDDANYAATTTAAIAAKLSKVAGGAAVENIGAVEWNVNIVAATGATEALDTSVYGVHDCTMDQSCTFTFTNPAPSGKETEFKLYLRGAFTPTFPASVDWADATPPTYTTPSIYVFSTVDAGTTWFGSQVGKAFG